MGKLIYGVASNDLKGSASHQDGRDVRYSTWLNMIRRCYSEKEQNKRPNYKECSVSEAWLSLSNFWEWKSEDDYKNLYLDKDLKCLGNKLYSKDNCLLITLHLNNFMLGISHPNPWRGILYRKDRSKFEVNIKNFGESHNYGHFNCEYKALDTLRTIKGSFIDKHISLGKESAEVMEELVSLKMRYNTAMDDRLTSHPRYISHRAWEDMSN